MKHDTIKSSSVRTEFAGVLHRVTVHKARVVVTRYGESLVAIIPIEDLRALEEFLSGRRRAEHQQRSSYNIVRENLSSP